MCKGTCACGRNGEGTCGRVDEALARREARLAKKAVDVALARRESRLAKKAVEKHNEIEERLPRYGGGIGINIDSIKVTSTVFDGLKK